MKQIIFILIGVFLSLGSFAGDKKRNGGDTLLCGSTYQVLDLYEAQTTYGYDLNIPQGSSYAEILQKLISRLDQHNPQRAALYRQFLNAFAKEVRFVPDSAFTKISDIGEGVPLPSNCTLHQTASQFTQATPTGQWYIINKDIWDQLDAANQAALVLHEFIYRDTYSGDNSLKDSIGVRHFNAYIISGKTTSASLKDYITALQFSGLQTAEYQGFTLQLHSGNSIPQKREGYPVNFKDDGQLLDATLGINFTLEGSRLLKNISCLEDSNLQNREPIKILFHDGYAEIQSNCMMKISLNSSKTLGYVLSKSIVLNSKNELVFITPANSDEVSFKYYGINYSGSNFLFLCSLKNRALMSFGPNEVLTKIYFGVPFPEALFNSTMNLNSNSVRLSLWGEYQLLFDSDGAATQFDILKPGVTAY